MQPPKPIGDGPDYENMAFHIWRGRGFLFDSTNDEWREPYQRSELDYSIQLHANPRNYPSTARPPMFPLMVAGVYGVLGRTEWAFATVRLFSATCLAVAGALAVQLTVRLMQAARSAKLGSWVVGGMATLFFFMINRTLRDYATDFLTEPLALLLMQVFVLLAISLCSHEYGIRSDSTPMHETRSQLVLSMWAGAVFGALILTRSMFVVWLPAIWMLFLVALPGDRATRFKLSTVVVLCACALCAPWWLRNCLVLDRFMPLGTQGATTLLGGYSDEALLGNGDWQAGPELQLRHELSQLSSFQTLTTDSEREIAIAVEASHRVRQWLWEHLHDLPILILRRIYVHWNPYAGASLLWKVPLILGAVGLLARREPARFWLLGLPLTSTVVVAGFYSTGGRFLVPLYGILFTVAGMGVGWSLLWGLATICGQGEPKDGRGDN